MAKPDKAQIEKNRRFTEPTALGAPDPDYLPDIQPGDPDFLVKLSVERGFSLTINGEPITVDGKPVPIEDA